MREKERVYELAKRLTKLKAEERSVLNELDKVRKQILEAEIEISEMIRKAEGEG